MLSSTVRGELDSVKDGLELVSRFRRFLDPDSGFATGEEVAALSEYLARVDALVHSLDLDADRPVYVVRSIYTGMERPIFLDPDSADVFVRKLLRSVGYPKIRREKDEEGQTGFFLSESTPSVSERHCLAKIEIVFVDAYADRDAASRDTSHVG